LRARPAISAHPIAVDLCTGSGAIALAIATECPEVTVYAVELDETAHAWAQRNVAKLAPDIQLLKGDARTALAELNGQVEVVVSNPPYIPWEAVPRQIEALADPSMALYGLGEDGLEVPRGIVVAAARLLKSGGTFIMEHGEEQGAEVRALLDPSEFSAVITHQDLTNRDRYTTAQRR
jgi:release factor glutamine methyltransferase